MLPPGALNFLKGHRDGVVYVLLALLSTGAGSATGPWAGVATLLVGGILYNVRCSSAERHQRDLAKQRLDEMALAIDAAKAKYRAPSIPAQSTLPLGSGGKREAERSKSSGGRQGG